MSEKIWHLKRCPLFERLTPEQMARLDGRCRVRKFPRGSSIYLPADLADGVLLLASGRVKICSVTHEGKQAILALIEPGELFGELAILDAGARDEYAEAADPSTVLLIPSDEMHRLMEEHPNLTMGVTKLVGLRRRRIERRLKYLLFRSNRERLVNLLLELAEQYGKPTTDGLLLDVRLSHQDLANIIGSTRESVTVMLGELQNDGYVCLGRRKIVLKNVTRLAASIDQVPAPSLVAPAAPGSPPLHSLDPSPCNSR